MGLRSILRNREAFGKLRWRTGMNYRLFAGNADGVLAIASWCACHYAFRVVGF